MKTHEIKRDRFNWIVFHPWGSCKQRTGKNASMKYTYFTDKNNLPWELRQCGLSEKAIQETMTGLPE